MNKQLCPRDLAILERGLAIPNVVTLAVEAAELATLKHGTNQHSKEGSSNDLPSQDEAATLLNVSPPTTFADRIASSPQLVSATITRAIKLAAYRKRQAARPPVMAVRFAGSK